jgi:site-specific recombinase XerD
VSFSATLNLRTPAQRNGQNTVRLQVILNRKLQFITLGFSWPEALFDRAAGKCLLKLPAGARPANYDQVLQQLVAAVGPDPAAVAEHNNLVIGKALGDANAIYRRYHLTDRHLSMDEFLREYNSAASRADFLEFMETRIRERYRRGQITANTHKSHLSTLNKLREFAAYSKTPGRRQLYPRQGRLSPQELKDLQQPLPFNSLTHKFANDFDSWMKNVHSSCLNTRSGRHRNVKTYLELARRDKISFDDPYEYFVNTTVKGKWKALSLAELMLLERYYKTLEPRAPWRRILQKFLFSCHCGLRLGDLKAIDQMKIDGQRLELKPHKTYRYDEQDLVLPITKKALSYLVESQQENECAGFHLYSDQYTNRQLQRIGQALGIETKMHHHIGRETFATNFMRQGGKLEVLQKLMGHKKLSMTMKYVHVDEAAKQAEIDRLDDLAA